MKHGEKSKLQREFSVLQKAVKFVRELYTSFQRIYTYIYMLVSSGIYVVEKTRKKKYDAFRRESLSADRYLKLICLDKVEKLGGSQQLSQSPHLVHSAIPVA